MLVDILVKFFYKSMHNQIFFYTIQLFPNQTYMNELSCRKSRLIYQLASLVLSVEKKWSSSFSFVSEFSLVKLTKMMSWSHARVERRLGGMQLAQILYKRQDKTAQIHQHLPSTIIYYESSKIFKENCCGICNSSNIPNSCKYMFWRVDV